MSSHQPKLISTPEFLFLSFSPLRHEPSHHDFTLTPSSFTVQTSHLTDSLEEIANSLITIQNQLDSLATMVLQNRRGLDLTAEKGGLCLFLEEACWFYTNKSGIVKEAARNLTNGLENTPTHQQYMGKLGKQLELDVLGPTFSSSSPFIYPNSKFLLMFNVSFFKISSGSLTSLHQPNYPQATSNSI